MRYRWVDGHLDLAWLAAEGRDLTAGRSAEEGGVCLPGLRAGGVDLVLATIFTAPSEPGPEGYTDAGSAHDAGMRQLSIYRELEARREIRIIRSAADLVRHDAEAADGSAHRAKHAAPCDGEAPARPIGVVLLMENADPIRTPEESAIWFEAGVRIVGMAWAPGSRYAGGNTTSRGLSGAGRLLVRHLDELGMIHDVSHLSDPAFNDLLAATTRPVIASHSNCRAIAGPDPRHVSDAQIAAIAARRGIIGLNLFGRFLTRTEPATITDCLRHLDHIAFVAGTRSLLALGSDMDGGFPPSRLPEGLRRPQAYDALARALSRAGWTDEEIRGFAGENWLRFLSAHLAGAC